MVPARHRVAVVVVRLRGSLVVTTTAHHGADYEQDGRHDDEPDEDPQDQVGTQELPAPFTVSDLLV